jgi:hypothetical protein
VETTSGQIWNDVPNNKVQKSNFRVSNSCLRNGGAQLKHQLRFLKNGP